MAKSGVPLVIVESPAKARTLARFLGNKYRVEASYGHIRDLPESAAEVPAEIKGKSWGRMGVDTDGDFTPYYVVPADKKKNVTALRAAMKDASELILATDPDREGESISWHLRELLKPKVKVRRKCQLIDSPSRSGSVARISSDASFIAARNAVTFFFLSAGTT